MGSDDPDRAAILARRQRFIALALSGLATTACGKPKEGSEPPQGVQGGEGGGARPRTCLNVAIPEDDGANEGEEGSTGMPMPCLDVAVPEDEEVEEEPSGRPMPCLDVAPAEPPSRGYGDASPMACLMIEAPATKLWEELQQQERKRERELRERLPQEQEEP